MKLSGIALFLALAPQYLAAVELELAESAASSFSEEQRRAIHELAAAIEADVRAVLPSLPSRANAADHPVSRIPSFGSTRWS
jgi:hypothetical protein